MHQRTRKIMTMHKALHPRDDIDNISRCHFPKVTFTVSIPKWQFASVSFSCGNLPMSNSQWQFSTFSGDLPVAVLPVASFASSHLPVSVLPVAIYQHQFSSVNLLVSALSMAICQCQIPRDGLPKALGQC